MIQIPPFLALILFIVIIGLFFWGVYKTVKTQKKIYLFAMFPFVLLLSVMFYM